MEEPIHQPLEPRLPSSSSRPRMTSMDPYNISSYLFRSPNPHPTLTLSDPNSLAGLPSGPSAPSNSTIYKRRAAKGGAIKAISTILLGQATNAVKVGYPVGALAPRYRSLMGLGISSEGVDGEEMEAETPETARGTEGGMEAGGEEVVDGSLSSYPFPSIWRPTSRTKVSGEGEGGKDLVGNGSGSGGRSRGGEGRSKKEVTKKSKAKLQSPDLPSIYGIRPDPRIPTPKTSASSVAAPSKGLVDHYDDEVPELHLGDSLGSGEPNSSLQKEENYEEDDEDDEDDDREEQTGQKTERPNPVHLPSFPNISISPSKSPSPPQPYPNHSPPPQPPRLSSQGRSQTYHYHYHYRYPLLPSQREQFFGPSASAAAGRRGDDEDMYGGEGVGFDRDGPGGVRMRAFANEEDNEVPLPPSPIGLPGAWTWDVFRYVHPDDERERGRNGGRSDGGGGGGGDGHGSIYKRRPWLKKNLTAGGDFAAGGSSSSSTSTVTKSGGGVGLGAGEERRGRHGNGVGVGGVKKRERERIGGVGAGEALLLPPPFLDDKTNSTKESFEGLLGVRRLREENLRLRRQQRLLNKDRLPPPTFPASLLTTAGKLVSAIGPPGGVSSGPSSWIREANGERHEGKRFERRRDRGERAMRAFEVGEKVLGKMADKLRRGSSFYLGDAVRSMDLSGRRRRDGDGVGDGSGMGGEAMSNDGHGDRDGGEDGDRGALRTGMEEMRYIPMTPRSLFAPLTEEDPFNILTPGPADTTSAEGKPSSSSGPRRVQSATAALDSMGKELEGPSTRRRSLPGVQSLTFRTDLPSIPSTPPTPSSPYLEAANPSLPVSPFPHDVPATPARLLGDNKNTPTSSISSRLHSAVTTPSAWDPPTAPKLGPTELDIQPSPLPVSPSPSVTTKAKKLVMTSLSNARDQQIAQADRSGNSSEDDGYFGKTLGRRMAAAKNAHQQYQSSIQPSEPLLEVASSTSASSSASSSSSSSAVADIAHVHPLTPGIATSLTGEGPLGFFRSSTYALPRTTSSASLNSKSSQTVMPASNLKGVTILTAVSEPFVQAFSTLRSFLRFCLDFVIWVLVGDVNKVGTGGDMFDSVGGLLGVATFALGFTCFVAVHVGSLITSAAVLIKSIALFAYWVFINLSGKTDLGAVISKYYRLTKVEWDLVAREDGQTLTGWQCMVGLAELAALHAMTKERYLREGKGELVRIETRIEEEDEPAEDGENGRTSTTPESEPERRVLRKKPSMRRSKSLAPRRSLDLGGGEGDSLIITADGDSILEGTIFSPRPDDPHYFGNSLGPSPQDPFDPHNGLQPQPSIGSTFELFNAAISQHTPLALSLPRPGNLMDEVSSREQTSIMLKALKRHARFATASYGLHSYILAPPTPLFTPSGATLPHNIFRYLSKINDKSSVLHVAIQKDYVGAWGPNGKEDDIEDEWEPSFYLIRDHDNHEVVVVFRGTQSLHDIVVDLSAHDEEIDLPAIGQDHGTETFRVHGGILRAARRLIHPSYSPLFAKLKAALEENEGYSLILTGHSLGAACASTVVVLLAQFRPTDSSDPERGFWEIASTSGLPSGRPIRAITFAHPTTLDALLCARCNLGNIPLVFSVSLGADVIPRIGSGQVREVRRALGRLAALRRGFLERKRRKSDGDDVKHSQMSVLKAWWTWKRLGGGQLPEDENSEPPRKVRDIEAMAWKLRQEIEAGQSDIKGKIHGGRSRALMYSPGRVYHVDRLPPKLELERKKSLQARLDAGEDVPEEDEQIWGLYRVDHPENFFAMPWLEADMVRSHLPRLYLDAVESL